MTDLNEDALEIIYSYIKKQLILDLDLKISGGGRWPDGTIDSTTIELLLDKEYVSSVYL